MNRFVKSAVCTTCISLFAAPCFAHFGMVIPDQPIITQDNRSTNITLSFIHPFELMGMDLVKPQKLSVITEGKETDLLPALSPTKVLDHEAWQLSYDFKRPGMYQFVMEPQPYWEAAEDLSIIHYTKVIIPAFGEDTGWDEPVGLPTEIVPMLRPFGNYAGNSFSGQVLLKGKPVPNAEVEVEYYNADGKYEAPTDYHVTQVIKADGNGIFSFTCPLAGWWGFAALNEADYTIKDPQGNEKGVELGGVLWTYFSEYKTK